MLVITRIPTHRNDGSKVSQRERRALLTLVRDAFGGYSLEGPFQGSWVEDDGRVHTRRVTVWRFLCRPTALAKPVSCSCVWEGSWVNGPSTLRFVKGARSLHWTERRCQDVETKHQEPGSGVVDAGAQLAETPGLTWVEANNAVYGPGGPFARLFPTARDRAAFAKTEESRQLDQLIDGLPEPPVAPQRREYSGKFNVRLPKSLHAALASEAEAEGVSLNQLVVAKLALHLQAR